MTSRLDVKALVRRRDNYKCVDCGSEQDEGRSLDVHRLKPGSRYTVRGCVTVCQKCHRQRHKGLKVANRDFYGKPVQLGFTEEEMDLIDRARDLAPRTKFIVRAAINEARRILKIPSNSPS